jgi:hypothetical protein
LEAQLLEVDHRAWPRGRDRRSDTASHLRVRKIRREPEFGPDEFCGGGVQPRYRPRNPGESVSALAYHWKTAWGSGAAQNPKRRIDGASRCPRYRDSILLSSRRHASRSGGSMETNAPAFTREFWHPARSCPARQVETGLAT